MQYVYLNAFDLIAGVFYSGILSAPRQESQKRGRETAFSNRIDGNDVGNSRLRAEAYLIQISSQTGSHEGIPIAQI